MWPNLLKKSLTENFTFCAEKVGSFLSEWLDIILGLPQGSTLRLILFNVFINDLRLLIKETDIFNFVDDTILYAGGKDLDAISNKLGIETNAAINGLTIMKWELVHQVSSYKSRLIFLSKYKTLKKTCLLMENPLHHQIQLVC